MDSRKNIVLEPLVQNMAVPDKFIAPDSTAKKPNPYQDRPVNSSDPNLPQTSKE